MLQWYSQRPQKLCHCSPGMLGLSTSSPTLVLTASNTFPDGPLLGAREIKAKARE